jgi:hypothetical protein
METHGLAVLHRPGVGEAEAGVLAAEPALAVPRTTTFSSDATNSRGSTEKSSQVWAIPWKNCPASSCPRASMPCGKTAGLCISMSSWKIAITAGMSPRPKAS